MEPRHITMVAIDEADRMFDMGFAPQVSAILERLPTTRQTMLLSATMPDTVQALTNRHLDDPVRIDTHHGAAAVEHVRHRVTLVHPGDRVDLLLHLHRDGEAGRMLIFCRTRRRTGWVAAALARHGVRVGQLHGDRSQAQRRRALKAFASGELDVLVATDVGSRGLHIQGVRTVVNYDMPGSAEDLIHRSGRASHGSRHPGTAWTLLGERDLDAWYEVSPAAGVTQDPESVPGFSGAKAAARSSGPRAGKRRHETKHRPGPGRRKRASRPIDPRDRPGSGVVRRDD